MDSTQWLSREALDSGGFGKYVHWILSCVVISRLCSYFIGAEGNHSYTFECAAGRLVVVGAGISRESFLACT